MTVMIMTAMDCNENETFGQFAWYRNNYDDEPYICLHNDRANKYSVGLFRARITSREPQSWL